MEASIIFGKRKNLHRGKLIQGWRGIPHHEISMLISGNTWRASEVDWVGWWTGFVLWRPSIRRPCRSGIKFLEPFEFLNSQGHFYFEEYVQRVANSSHHSRAGRWDHRRQWRGHEMEQQLVERSTELVGGASGEFTLNESGDFHAFY